MDASLQTPIATPEAANAAQQGLGGQNGPEIDLDRLVWDPEYRYAMQSYLKNKG